MANVIGFGMFRASKILQAQIVLIIFIKYGNIKLVTSEEEKRERKREKEKKERKRKERKKERKKEKKRTERNLF